MQTSVRALRRLHAALRDASSARAAPPRLAAHAAQNAAPGVHKALLGAVRTGRHALCVYADRLAAHAAQNAAPTC